VERQQFLKPVLILPDILKPRHVDLALATNDPAQGFDALARRLEDDVSVTSREAFHAAIKRCGKPIGTQSLLSHIRTDHVSTMLMAAGRMPLDNSAPGIAPVGAVQEVHFLFLIAVPMTLAADYLRMVGALARSLRNPQIVRQLRETASAQDFVRILCAEAAAM
jgi:mannitol/fructose-specific phosphotransferase system IIA component (Ntr-type)